MDFGSQATKPLSECTGFRAQSEDPFEPNTHMLTLQIEDVEVVGNRRRVSLTGISTGIRFFRESTLLLRFMLGSYPSTEKVSLQV